MTTCECQLLSRFIYDDLVQSNLLFVKKKNNLTGGKTTMRQPQRLWRKRITPRRKEYYRVEFSLKFPFHVEIS